MDWKIEVVTLPVADQERAKRFYADQLGFHVDIDHPVSDDFRMLQLTPPGSGCSIHLGGTSMPPGSLESLFLVVPDVTAARAQLVERGVEVSEVKVYDSGDYRTAVEGDDLDLVGCVFLSDPDGNRWTVQQIPPRG
ncbi:MAG TPA: glyoxalase superfamily protein [Actinomycetota bacterium]|nr:glyoxalase superfamily protein [Actinomycetota bacterium]